MASRSLRSHFAKGEGDGTFLKRGGLPKRGGDDLKRGGSDPLGNYEFPSNKKRGDFDPV